jgi:ABC-type nickel/cobalt efflux system permease component RcnA
MELTSLSLLGLGFVFGLKHALDADHVVAVSTIVSERRSLLSSSLVGMLWGAGHTAALLVAGLGVLVLRLQIPERVALGMEFGVGIMLVVLGGNLLWKLWRGGTLHVHAHAHGSRLHIHPHIHMPHEAEVAHTHHNWVAQGRPFVVGLVHGMAGSAALMLLVLSTIPSPWLGVLYILVFGVGSIGGMLAMSAAISLPLVFTAQRFHRANALLRLTAGLASVTLGLVLMWEIGVHEGLLRL